MQAMGETIFDIIYLFTVISMGFIMVKKGKDEKQYKLFGWMAVLLGFGDAFHLVPRSYALLTTGLEANAKALGFGKFVTSITMTIFYIILYHIWQIRYEIKDRRSLTQIVYALGIVRIFLCFLPQNEWFNYNAPVIWGIIRNIPFALIGLIIIYLFFTEAKRNNDVNMRFMWLAIVLSFGFYIPVVLWSDTIPPIGALMIPKTIAYVWVVFMGYKDMKQNI
ncbi:putative membrane protein [Gottschalkia purinilytica]|uniref:Putative membrane protein n=1 Tax=Gottschalkia purinilytica TaxID=1503 RepID=A0A0L0W9W8_GOTPU|nr:hypothetical protein [Gottschalkia purinilytica]KNF08348.1 putative membrane protein [Gottschalkia purinilytica]